MLTNLANSSVIKRLTHEFKFLQNTNLQIISINITEELIDIKIQDNNYATNKMYTFVLNHNYPFSQPTVYINNKSYTQFVTISSLLSLKMVKEIWGYECLCCNTYMCANNWRPTITLINIINEIQVYRNIRTAIMYKVLCKKIALKYLYKDIKLEKWLYL